MRLRSGPRVRFTSTLAIVFFAAGCYADGGGEGLIDLDPSSNPVVTTVVPATASVGDIVTLFGSNFGNDASQVSVTFGSVHVGQVLFVAPTNMEVRIPAGASGNLQIVVTVDGRAAIGPNIVVL